MKNDGLSLCKKYVHSSIFDNIELSYMDYEHLIVKKYKVCFCKKKNDIQISTFGDMLDGESDTFENVSMTPIFTHKHIRKFPVREY